MTLSEHIRENIQHSCRLLSLRIISDDVFMMELSSPEIASKARPGQFVNVRCEEFLSRPVSICGADRDKGTFTLGIRIKGKGTRQLTKLQVGTEVSLQGPLGNGFDLTGVNSCVAVGGGIGIFPLMFLLDEAKRLGIPSTAVCGYTSASESFCTLDLRNKAGKTCFSSDCGDMDFHGNATEAFAELDIQGEPTVFTCGPVPMMRGVYYHCVSRGLKCFASLEERMGCGTGICLVCACEVKIQDVSGGTEYKRCCYDGPVFDASEVVWD